MRQSQNVFNKIFRFLIIISMYLATSIISLNLEIGFFRFLLTLLAPLITLGIWTSFISRVDAEFKPPFTTYISGKLRLALELVLLIGSGISLILIGIEVYGVVLILATLLHYFLSIDRIQNLLEE
ncbi:MAG: DUF2568 domain-containing protein [Candidatus Dojkabacteria bacterium]|nr:DUF2568 domain-containing protein [Candidatus Dojkabacteria bacterium]MDQ7021857.1 DUF2568 domain-containing protein [Candidatus Dojkabacteria bacterium]